MGKYKKCPRCELNWILAEEELCEVCKAELGKASKICLLEDDEDLEYEERICPICKVNYLDADEDICAACRQEQAEKDLEKENEDDWKDYINDEEPITDDDDCELSLNQLQDDEAEEFDDDEESENIDDFDDDIDDLGNIDDYDDDEDEDIDDEEF